MCPKFLRTVSIFGLILLASPHLSSQESRAQSQPLGQISGQVRYSEGGQPAFNILVKCDSFNSGYCGQVRRQIEVEGFASPISPCRSTPLPCGFPVTLNKRRTSNC